MADGTIKQVNPFTGTEVWAVPGRGAKPTANEVARTAKKLKEKDFVAHCSFCEERLFETPPEKARLIQDEHGHYHHLMNVAPEDYQATKWRFRRVPNLFEIVTVKYWKQNYAFTLPKEVQDRKDEYLASEVGRKHVFDVLKYRLKMSGTSEEKLEQIGEDELIQLADAFFGGSHELVIANQHFLPNATHDDQLFSSGDMTPEQHFQYFKFTVNAMTSIFERNQYARYISVFQNWLAPAGASFDHLHKQLVGLDEWGASIRHQTDMLRLDINVFNQYGANLAAMHNLIFAENDSAIAFVGIGHRHPTLEIFSKSYVSRPYEHSDEELRGVSDLVHACHAATGAKVSSNEEWYYTPVDAIYKMPWHVLIKWRVNTSAGFEGGTGIYINPLTPLELRDRIVPKLYALRDEEVIAKNIRLAEECKISPNPLRYYLD
jgi:galactose-1-phosphate uridylyltransferase